MIKDLQVAFQQAVDHTNGKIIIDHYSLKEGLYLRIDPNISLEENRAQQENRLLTIKKKTDVNVAQLGLKDWFLQRDFYSSAISANKFVDTITKKLHNTNFLTLFMKLDTFISDNPKQAKQTLNEKYLLENEWNEYINTFFIQKISASDQKMRGIIGYSELKVWIESDERNELRKKILQFINKNSVDLIQWIHHLKHEYKLKNYARIFFEAEANIYKREYLIYVYPNIFLKNDFNIETENGVYGVPSYNMGLNSKKPYLMHRTKKSNVPLLVSPDEAVLRKNLFSWFQAQKPFTVHQFYERTLFNENNRNKANETVHIGGDGNGVVNYFEKLPFSQGERLDRPFLLKNIIQAKEWMNEKGYEIAENRDPILDPMILLKITSRLFFKNYLHADMLFSEPKIKAGVFPGEMLNLFLSSRQALYDFFFKGTELTLKPMIDHLTQAAVEIQLTKSVKGINFGNLGQAYNLRLAWLRYFNNDGSEEKVRTLKELVATLKDKFTQKTTVEINDDQEFYFISGQLAYYLLSQSEAKDKNFGMFEGVLRVKKPAFLKRQLEELFKTYSHAISMSHTMFKNALGAVQVYQPENKVIENEARDYLMAGILANNIFYQKKNSEN